MPKANDSSGTAVNIYYCGCVLSWSCEGIVHACVQVCSEASFLCRASLYLRANFSEESRNFRELFMKRGSWFLEDYRRPQRMEQHSRRQSFRRLEQYPHTPEAGVPQARRAKA